MFKNVVSEVVPFLEPLEVEWYERVDVLLGNRLEHAFRFSDWHYRRGSIGALDLHVLHYLSLFKSIIVVFNAVDLSSRRRD